MNDRKYMNSDRSDIPARTWLELDEGDGKFSLGLGRARIHDLHGGQDPLLNARRAGDDERPCSHGNELGVENEKRDAAEMITVQMGDNHGFDIVWIDSGLLHGDQRRCAAIHKKGTVGRLDQDTCLKPAAASEGISGAQKLNGEILFAHRAPRQNLFPGPKPRFRNQQQVPAGLFTGTCSLDDFK